MAKPKLALIPAAQGSDKLFSVLPSSGVGDFDFIRPSSATRINSKGLIEEVATKESRLNYPMIDGKVVGCPHHILEPQRTNLVTYSEDFSQWIKQNGGTGSAPVVTSNYAISPDGTLNADRVVFDINGGTTSSDFSQIADAITSSIGDVTNSVWIKSNTESNYNISFVDPEANYTSIVVTTEWQRFDVTSTTSSTASAFRLRLRGSEATSDYADVSVWGAQVEQGSYPTSYIPTNGSTVTRSAETANGSGDADTFNDSEGVLMAEISNISENQTTTVAFSVSDGSTSNTVSVYYFGTSGLYYDIFNSDGTRSGNTPMTKIQQTYNNKISLKYKSGDIALWVNGFEVDTNVGTLSLNGLSELSFDYGNGNFPFYGSAKQLQYFDSALSDTEIEELTSWESFIKMANGQNYTIK